MENGGTKRANPEYETFPKGIEHPDPTIAVNVSAGLTRATMRLLQRQLARLEKDFPEQGGLRDSMTNARLGFRQRLRHITQQRPQARTLLRKSE